MAQLRQEQDEFVRRGAQIVVVGPEEPEAFARYFQENDLPFIGLPDPRHGVLKLYGQEVNLFKLGRMPAQVVIDRQGTARYIHYGHSMQDIPSNAELFEVLDSLPEGPAPADPRPGVGQARAHAMG
jgi:peroxiredoxin Q/BCP